MIVVSNYYKSASVENHPRMSWKRKQNNFFFKTVDNNDNFIRKEIDSERELRNVSKNYILSCIHTGT